MDSYTYLAWKQTCFVPEVVPRLDSEAWERHNGGNAGCRRALENDGKTTTEVGWLAQQW